MLLILSHKTQSILGLRLHKVFGKPIPVLDCSNFEEFLPTNLLRFLLLQHGTVHLGEESGSTFSITFHQLQTAAELPLSSYFSRPNEPMRALKKS